MADSQHASRTAVSPGADDLKIGGPSSHVQSLRTASTVWMTWSSAGVVRQAVVNFPPGPIFPRTQGPFIRASQDKRSVVPIELADVDQWLHGSVTDAAALVRLAPVEDVAARPTM